MLPSLLTTLFFALSTIFAQRSIRALGSTRANIGRLVFAFVILGTVAWFLGAPFGGAGRNWLLLSGVIGMGLGDLAFFGALPLLGSRLTILMGQCLAAPIAALLEWLWLDTRLTAMQGLFGLVVIAGVAVALMPSRSQPPKVRVRWTGFLFGLGAAAGQGIGAVVSRKANLVAMASGEHINGFTAAFQRISGGLVITLAYFAVVALLDRRREQTLTIPAQVGDTTTVSETPAPALQPASEPGAVSNAAPSPAPAPKPARTWRSYLWVPANSGCGAVLGVSCYQWALFSTPSAIVLPIVATTPLAIIPFSYWFEGERPSRRSLLGGFIAVLGAAGLAIVR